MRIALDGLPLCQSLTGIGHYTFELAQHLAELDPGDRIDLISPRSFVVSLPASKSGQNLQLLNPTRSPILRYWWKAALPGYLKRNDIAVFHGTNYELPHSSICATVVTIHDLSTLLLPDTHERKNVWRARKRLPAIGVQATMVITPTESVRLEVNSRLSIPLEKIAVVPEAARHLDHDNPPPSALKERFGIAGAFVLYVGTVEPRKNLTALVQAFENLANQYSGLQLVIAGKRGWMVDDLFRRVRQSPVGNRVIFTGYIDESDLASLYSSCRVFVYPSIYEGFGLPPLEAMAAGAPVIASRIPSIEEVLGSAAYLVEPTAEGIRAALVELLDDPKLRARLIKAGKERVAKYSWRETASRAREVYLEAVDRFGVKKRGCSK